MRELDASVRPRRIADAAVIQVRDGRGGDLVGVTGHSGPRAIGYSGAPLGLDQIIMEPGTRFDLHEHEGDHILYVLAGEGAIDIDGVLHPLREGDAVFVPAEHPHGVTTVDGAGKPFTFLAFGIPHHPLHDEDRMRLVELNA